MGRASVLLMYGRMLSNYTADAVETLQIDGIVSTFHRWFPKFYWDLYGEMPPKSGKWTFDWRACKAKMLASPLPEPMKRHVIVDEGQDMPADFYFMLRVASKSMLILADENQRITQDQSTLDEIRAATGITDTIRLGQNHRNTRGIAELAATFYTGKPSGIPGLPSPDTNGKPALRWHAKLHQTIDYIASVERKSAQARIGVLLPYAEQVKQYYNRLSDKTTKPVEVYLNTGGKNKIPPPELSRPGVKILSWASAKGLDFDVVLLPELQSVREDPGAEGLQMKLYVLCSRARQKLELLYSGEGEPQLIRSLPPSLVDVIQT